MSTGRGGDHDRFPDAAAREDVADLVDVVARWRLVEGRWPLVADALGRVSAALEAGDRDGFRRAAADVGMLGPVRATRIGAEPAVPAPPRVRELTDELLHRVTERAGRAEDDQAPPPRSR